MLLKLARCLSGKQTHVYNQGVTTDWQGNAVINGGFFLHHAHFPLIHKPCAPLSARLLQFSSLPLVTCFFQMYLTLDFADLYFLDFVLHIIHMFVLTTVEKPSLWLYTTLLVGFVKKRLLSVLSYSAVWQLYIYLAVNFCYFVYILCTVVSDEKKAIPPCSAKLC